MSRAALIIQIQIPDRTPGQNIQIHADAAVQESGVCQTQIAAQNRGKVQLLLFCNGTQHHCPGNIGRALIILTARIYQKHSFRF